MNRERGITLKNWIYGALITFAKEYSRTTLEDNPDRASEVAMQKVESIINQLKIRGYRPRPKLTLISDEEIKKATGAPMILSGHRRLIQAQLDHDRETEGE